MTFDDKTRYTKAAARKILNDALPYCKTGSDYSRGIVSAVNTFCDRVQGMNATLENDKVLHHSLARIVARLSVLAPASEWNQKNLDQSAADYVNRSLELV